MKKITCGELVNKLNNFNEFSNEGYGIVEGSGYESACVDSYVRDYDREIVYVYSREKITNDEIIKLFNYMDFTVKCKLIDDDYVILIDDCQIDREYEHVLWNVYDEKSLKNELLAILIDCYDVYLEDYGYDFE